LVFGEAETRNVKPFLEQRAVIAMAAQPQMIVRSSACEGGGYLKAVSNEQRASVEASEKTEPCAERPLCIGSQPVVLPWGIFSGGAPLIRVFKERPHEPVGYLDGDRRSQPRRCPLLGLGSHSEHGELPMTLRLRTQPRLLRRPPTSRPPCDRDVPLFFSAVFSVGQ